MRASPDNNVMRFFETIRHALALPAQAAAPLESPWASPNHLMPMSFDPVLETRTLSRSSAMSVPTVARCRRLIVGSIARLPLVATRAGQPLDEQPLWMSRTDGDVSPYHRLAWTIDDLLFHGWSLWAIDRDARGHVTRAARVPYDLWELDSDGRVLYQGREVDSTQVCLIPSLDEGVLVTGRDAINHAKELNNAAARAAATPAANIELHQTQGAPLAEKDIQALVQSWAAARRGAHGGVAYTNQSIEVKEHGSYDAHLVVEGRNAASVDVARAMGIPAQLIDASVPHATMTYQNGETRNAEFVDYCLAPLMAALVARLGMDDIVPRGVAVEFDTTELTSVLDHNLDVPDNEEH